jgi:Cu-Zn family superoxide dismutase
MQLIQKALLISCSLFMVTACASKPPSAERETLPTIAHEPPPTLPAPSTSELNGHQGSQVHGTLIFTNEGKTVHVVGEFAGLKPNSEHGLHVHEKGSCDGERFEGAGGHFNPASMKHGGANTKMRHAGDLGNVKADDKGHATIDARIPNGPEVDTFGGKSVILHAKTDDLKSQPAGNSGDRIACGLVIQQR